MGENTTSYTSDSGLIARLYNQLQKLNSKKIKLPINNQTTEKNRQFSIKKKTIMAENYFIKCSISLVIREMHGKTTLRFHLTPVRMTVIKNTNDNECWGQDMGEGEHFPSTVGSVN